MGKDFNVIGRKWHDRILSKRKVLLLHGEDNSQKNTFTQPRKNVQLSNPFQSRPSLPIWEARDIVLCSWARHFTPTMPLSTQVYKWVPANLMLGVTLRWTGIPSRGEWKYSLSLHATETGDKRRPDGPSRLVADFTFTIFAHACIYFNWSCQLYFRNVFDDVFLSSIQLCQDFKVNNGGP